MQPFAPTVIKIAPKDFNSCPGAYAIGEYFYKHHLTKMVAFIDIEDEYWQNDEATMVLTILNGDDPGDREKAILAIGKFATDFNADEYEWEYIDFANTRTLAIRIWWD